MLPLKGKNFSDFRGKNFWSLEDRETIEEMGQHENIKPLDSIPAQDIS